MNKPLVSVCVPVYNGEPYLDACLQSIADQTLGDFEVLIIDDCSSDAGMTTARRWAAADPRFKVHVNASNLGLVGNWNRSIGLAEGRWVKFLFQDDLMDPTCLDDLVKAGEGGGFVACARVLLYEEGIDEKLRADYADHRESMQRIYGAGSGLTGEEYTVAKIADVGLNIVGEPSVTLIERSLFDRFGLFDPLLVQLCDSEMWNRLGASAGVRYVPKELVRFRVHQGSASEANRGRKFRSEVLDILIEINRLCYAPVNAAFRQHARATGTMRSLKNSLRHRGNAAFETARLATNERPPNFKLQEEVRAVLGSLPGYTRARLWYVVHRVAAFFGRGR